MTYRTITISLASATACLLLVTSSCASRTRTNRVGGELVGSTLASWKEPVPYGMVLIPQGSIVLGHTQKDSIWGDSGESKAISVDAFWMDQMEVTNAQWRQFVYYVRDSIIRERLADPTYGGNPDYKITTDKYDNPIEPHLDWSKPLPTERRATEEELNALNSVYYTNPITRERRLDPNQMIYRYNRYDHHLATLYQRELLALRNPALTQQEIEALDLPMIAKDTAYLDDNGRIIRETLSRRLSSEYDFLNSYIINIYPEESCWTKDFPNSTNSEYARLYFNHPGYDNYPVVGISWEQAQAFCAWRSQSFRQSLNLPEGVVLEDFRLPTEAEWEYAARVGDSNRKYPWSAADVASDKHCYLGNFKPEKGDYTSDGYLITSQVGSFSPNDFGLYDMAGNVAEWTESIYSASSYKDVDDINPEINYTADKNDPLVLRRKVVRGGSWKDVARFIQSATRSYEQQEVAHSYIGFRCVRRAISFTPTKKSKRK